MDDLKTSSKQWKWKAGSGTRLPPDVGVKYAANVWVHNYDYRTPSANGCPFCYKNTR